VITQDPKVTIHAARAADLSSALVASWLLRELSLAIHDGVRLLPNCNQTDKTATGTAA